MCFRKHHWGLVLGEAHKIMIFVREAPCFKTYENQHPVIFQVFLCFRVVTDRVQKQQWALHLARHRKIAVLLKRGPLL